jgi:YfiH family protein
MFTSLNFGNPSDLAQADRDPPSNIRENFRRVLSSLHCEERELVEVHQVHGPEAHIVRRGHPAHPTPHDTKADALITDDPTRILAVRVADCAPVLLVSHDGRIVAVAHAGWRGAISPLIANTVEAMQSLGATQIAAAVGPCIGPDHFEVGPEVADQFKAEFGEHVVTPTPPKSLLNLKLAIQLQLNRAGVSQVETLPHCTACDPTLFFSHRCGRGRTGRMIGIIGPGLT